MKRSSVIRTVVLATVLGLWTPAFAQDGAEDKPAQTESTAAPANAEPVADATDADAPLSTSQNTSSNRDFASDEPLIESDAPISIEHIDILVENEPFSVRSRRTATGGVLIEAGPIFTHLKGKASTEGTVLSYRRYQDGVLLSIDMATGEAAINGRVAGFLPSWKARETADTWLGPNAIAFLTGTVPEEDNIGRWVFNLSDQLRPKFDLDLWVEGVQITNPVVEPRTIGAVLLIPLEAVTQALGHTVEVDGNVITVQRLQDSTTLELDLTNGLVSVNNVPRGITPNFAFADIETLLLPFSAVETLTGTHIEILPGADRIDVRLDDRLGGGVLPGARVVDEVAQTGFTPETLDYRLSDRGPVNLTFGSRFRSLNTQLVYDSAGGFDNIRELQPGFVGLNVQSLDGWVGSIGDANTRLRELSGVGASRIRGITWRDQNQNNGNIIAVAAGRRSSGSTPITDDAARPTFGGLVAGVRLLKADQSQDVGISASVTDGFDAGRVVIGGQKSIVPTRDAERIGLDSLFASADTGLFFGPTGVQVDVRGRVQARGRVTRNIGVQASVDYQGARFRSSDTAIVDAEENGQTLASVGSSFTGSISTDWRSTKPIGPFSGIAAGLRASHTRTGGSSGGNNSFFTGSLNGRIPAVDLSVSADVGYSIGTDVDGSQVSTRNFNLRGQKRFGWGNVQATYTNTTSDLSDSSNRFVSSASVQPFRWELDKGARVSAGPTASLVVADGDFSTRFGATLAADSGQKFGTKFNVQGRLSALQSIDPDQDATGFLASLNATYDLGRYAQLTATYLETFQGNRDVSFGLRGRLTFNEPRKYTKPKEGLGVLKGVVYFDRNRDGVRQDDEPGVTRVRVQVSGTRLGLNVDRDGRFTIRNMPEGLYGLVVDRRSLPLGLVVPDDVAARATVAEGRITELAIPIIASGQIRGSIFVDANVNGEIDVGERRVEGTYITLKPASDDVINPETVSLVAASFGQFSFENLSPGTYDLSVNHEGIVHTQTVVLEDDNLFQVVPFAVGFDPLDVEDAAGNLEVAGPEIADPTPQEMVPEEAIETELIGSA